MQGFEYIPARTVEEAIDLLSGAKGPARVLAGGTDLIVQLRERRRQTSLIVDIKAIPEANTLSYDPELGLQIGAAVPCYRISDATRSLDIYPGLRSAVDLIGGTQIQGRATLGGNLCNASPAADTIPALIVHHALCQIYGQDGYRQVPVEEFCTAPGKTVLASGEILVSLILPPAPAGFGAYYLRFTPRNEMDIAVAGAGASVVLDRSGATCLSARVALSAVAPTPLYVKEAGDALAGCQLSPETIEAAARIARDAARPIDDMRGTAAQRRHLAGVLTTRVIQAAVIQARKGD